MSDLKKINKLAELLMAKHRTIAVAESVTSGRLQHIFSLAKNATQFFEGGITVYNLSQKALQLDVDPVHAMSCNCVSPQVAGEMAKAVTRLFKCDAGIAITGYAAKVPELNVDELFAYCAVCVDGHIIASVKLTSTKKKMEKVQGDYVSQILELVLDNFEVHG